MRVVDDLNASRPAGSVDPLLGWRWVRLGCSLWNGLRG